MRSQGVKDMVPHLPENEYLQTQAHACQWAGGSSPWEIPWTVACQASSSAPYAVRGLFYC